MQAGAPSSRTVSWLQLTEQRIAGTQMTSATLQSNRRRTGTRTEVARTVHLPPESRR